VIYRYFVYFSGRWHRADGQRIIDLVTHITGLTPEAIRETVHRGEVVRHPRIQLRALPVSPPPTPLVNK